MTQILIVDDDLNTLGLLEIILRKEGYQVIKASEGHEAISLARKHCPELVILDMMMPDMDGTAVCQVIRQDPGIRTTPIIMLTAARSFEKKMESLEYGVNEYLTKPVHPNVLRARVRFLLNREIQIPETGERQSTGQVLAVIGTSGGAGTTTVALNLAASAAEGCPDAVLVELVPGSSNLTAQLGCTPDRAYPHWSCLSMQNLHMANLQKNLLSLPNGLALLPGLPDALTAIETDGYHAGQVQRVIQELSGHFRSVFLDLGRGYNSRVQAAQPYITDYIIVMPADPLSLPASIDQVKSLVKKGVPWEKIHIILVAFAPFPYFLDLPNSKQALKANGIQNNVLMYIPPVRQLIFTAHQKHVPMVQLDPEGLLIHQYFQQAIQRLIQEEEPLATQ